MRKTITICALLLFALTISISNVEAYNPRVKDAKARTVQQYGSLAKHLYQEGQPGSNKSSSISSLGAFAADGGSPGEIVGRTYRDDQSHFSPGHSIGWRGATTPQMHFIFCAQACGGNDNPDVCARWLHYNMFDPTTSPGGVFISGTNGIPLQISPFTEGGLYPNMDVDENGRIISIGEGLTSGDGKDYLRWVKFWWDISPTNVWGTFQQDSIPNQPDAFDDYNFHYPIVAYQEYNGMYYTHALSINGGDGANDIRNHIGYWRKEAASTGVFDNWTYTELSDSVWSNSYSIAVAQDGGGEVSLVWVGYYQQSGWEPIFVKRSYDAGASWEAEFTVVFEEDDWQPWLEVSSMIDSDGFTHVIYNAGGVDPCRIIHWTDRIDEGHAGGAQSLIEHFDFDGLASMCGRFYWNLFIVGKVMMSECNGRLYATWMQAGEPDKGDSLDCSIESAELLGFDGSYNGDIYMSISSSLDGSLWDARRNVTNSKSPECDGTDEFPCDHDNYPSPARIGMNTSPSSVGTTYWNAVPGAFEVRDFFDASYPDTGWYIDVQFINDLYPGISRYNDDILWTNSPIKWFRLPCIDPIIEPRILVPEPFQHPENWVKSGESQEFSAEVLNLGNAPLTINNVTAHDVDGTGWYTINTTSLVIPAATTDTISITLNPTLINPGPGGTYGIEAWFLIDSDDPHNPVDSFLVRSVIADTVMSINYGIVTTGKGVQLGTLNNGSAANYPNTSGYLAFENDSTGLHDDCDSQEVYLYELSPIIMYDASTYFWNTYYDNSDPEPGVNFIPVLSTDYKEESCSSGGMSQYVTGEFVTGDSTLGMVKVWGAPDDDVSYVVEKWMIYSYDGQAHNGVRVAEWTDVDVPSDSSVNNFGTISDDSTYLYVSGQESDNDVTCINNDSRFYTTGLLGYYTAAEKESNPAVNNTDLEGAYVQFTEALMPANYEFNSDSVWSYLELNDFFADNAEWEDQRTLLDFGTFDIGGSDTLVIWVLHGALINAVEADVAIQVADARVWYMSHRDEFGVCGCCGAYTGGLVGNVDYDIDGKLNLTDITRLIDRVYVSKVELDCEGNGDIAEPLDGKINLADITRLIDRVYVSKTITTSCP